MKLSIDIYRKLGFDFDLHLIYFVFVFAWADVKSPATALPPTLQQTPFRKLLNKLKLIQYTWQKCDM